MVMPSRKVSRDLTAFVTDLNLKWVHECLAAILEGGRDLPDTDLWPPEMAESTFAVALMDHWRHVPLDLGGDA